MTAKPNPRGGFAALILLLVIALAMTKTAPVPPPAAPTILLSVDRTLTHRLGLSRWTYERALRRAGARVVRLDYSALEAGVEPLETAQRLLAAADGLVLAGGGDVDPRLFGASPEIGRGVKTERDRFELALVATARRRALPLLAICRGAQLVNVEAGGTLRTLRPEPALRRRHKSWRGHAVAVAPESRLAAVLDRSDLPRVVSWHGQAVERPGRGLAISATSADGVVEAVETPPGEAQWILAVQWHPELSPASALQRRLFAGLVDAARARARDPL